MKVTVATLNVKLLGAFALAAFLAACDSDTPQKAEVVYQDTGACNVEGSVAHFKQGQKDQVFFNFDRSAILDEKNKVGTMKEFLCKYNKVGSVVGHCDTRGSSEYNLALGQRRANALKKSLVAHGLPAASICGAYSVGKERPLVVGNTEECHAQNRTSIFVLNNDGAEVSVAAPAAPVEQVVVGCVD
jgi:peptidoglycan-associated lipoprotein